MPPCETPLRITPPGPAQRLLTPPSLRPRPGPSPLTPPLPNPGRPPSLLTPLRGTRRALPTATASRTGIGTVRDTWPTICDVGGRHRGQVAKGPPRTGAGSWASAGLSRHAMNQADFICPLQNFAGSGCSLPGPLFSRWGTRIKVSVRYLKLIVAQLSDDKVVSILTTLV